MSKMTRNQQILCIMMEECGELIQACSKVMRFNTLNTDNLNKEMGDVLTMMDIMVENGYLNPTEIEARKPVKIEKLKAYSDIIR